MKKLFFFILFSILFLFPQEDGKNINLPEKKRMYTYIDMLIKRAVRDVNQAIDEGILKERVALVNFNYLGKNVFENKHREYLLKSIESIYKENKFLRFVKSVRALNKARLNQDLSEIQFINPKDKLEIEELTKELKTDKYAIVNLKLNRNKLELVIQIREINKHQNLWQGNWAIVWRASDWFVLVGLYPGVNLSFKEFPFYLSFRIGKVFFILSTKLELMFFLDIGGSFLNLESTNSGIKIHGLFGFAAHLDMLEWFNINYSSFEYFTTFRINLYNAIYNLTTQQLENSVILAVGQNFIINADYNVFFEVNVLSLLPGTSENNFFLTFGFYYRFDI